MLTSFLWFSAKLMKPSRSPLACPVWTLRDRPTGWSPVVMFVLGLGWLISLQSTLWGQGSADDYARMQRMQRLGLGQVDRVDWRPKWLVQHSALWYEVELADKSSEYFLVDLENGEKERLFDSRSVAEQMRALAGPDLTGDVGRGLELRFGENLQRIYWSVGESGFAFDRSAREVISVTLEDFPELPPQTVAELQVSGGSDQRVDLNFQNQTTGSVELFWIDSQARPRSYGTIEAGDDRTLSTYRGHVWLIRDSQGQNLQLLEARSDGQRISINSSEGITIEVPRRWRRQARFYTQGNPRRNRQRAGGPTADAENATPNRVSSPKIQVARSRSTSPDGLWEARVENYQLVVEPKSVESGQAIDGTPTNSIDRQAWTWGEGVSESCYFNGQFFWSPDSRFLIALQEEPPQSHPVYWIETAPADQLQPKWHQADYLKPGDKIRVLKPYLFNVDSGERIPVDHTLFATPWSLQDFRWSSDSAEFSFLYNQRGPQVLRVVGIQTDGTVRTIVEEVSDTFVDYTGKFFVDYLDQTGEIVWASQRDGWNHLYLIDRDSGQVKRRLTEGAWAVRDVQEVEQDKRRIYFSAGGVYPDQDPYYRHFAHVDLDGGTPVFMTAGDGDHRIEYSPDRQYLLATYSRVDMPPVTEVRAVESGRLICELERGDWTRLLEAGWRPPQRWVAKGRDGETDIYGVIYRPSNFDPNRKYPVIEYIYAGPQGAFVPKSFSPTRWEKSLAELGFIVVQMDGMGTNYRSKAFHDVCWKNLGDAGFPDRILWLQSAAQMEPAMDLERVGIFGGSAGGQNALRAVLAFGEHYHAAVADCGCHDNRMDKIWWNEQWMGWPIGPHYEEQSNVTQAHRLEGALLLIVGEMDRNVDPASTMQVVDALIKADKDFDLLVVPGGGHGVGSSPYGARRTADFFVRHLWGQKPRH